ncbi:MAG: hypothetical protein ACREQ5_11690 [Candidatus Dormibacteria bacterium]
MKLCNLGKLLKARGLPLPGDRYAVLAYGSNACPSQLVKKNLSGVPVLYGRLKGAEAVYAGRKTQNGYVPATLAGKKGIRSSWVTLLTRDQLAAMDISEGRHSGTYVLAELSDVQFLVGRRQLRPLYTYVDTRGGVMTRYGKAISLRSTNQKLARRLLANAVCKDAANILNYLTIPDPEPPREFSRFDSGQV